MCTSNILFFMPGDTSLSAHSISQNVLVNKTIFFLPSKEQGFFCRVRKFDGIILVMNGLGAEDLIYKWIHVLQLPFIIEESVT